MPDAGESGLDTHMTSDYIPGLKVIKEAITPSTEAELIEYCKLALKDVPVREWSGRSSMIRFGWSYDTKDRVREWLGEIPPWLDEWAQLYGSDSITINYYQPNAGIHPHVDSIDFADPIRIVSLGCDTTMAFQKQDIKIDVRIPARSMTIIGGESRYDWTHGIEPFNGDGRSDRWSIVFRKLVKTIYGNNRTTSSGTVAGSRSTMP